MKLIFTAVLIAGFAGSIQARIGETEAQSQTRYGQSREDLTAPTDKPLLPGAVEKCYEYQGWRIRAAFAGGTCQVIEYVHIPENGMPKQITDAEVAAILEAEKGKSRWKEEKIKSPGAFGDIERGLKGAFKLNKWERTDGATAEFALGLVLKISDRNADDWAKRLAKEAGKKDPKAGPKEPVPKFCN